MDNNKFIVCDSYLFSVRLLLENQTSLNHKIGGKSSYYTSANAIFTEIYLYLYAFLDSEFHHGCFDLIHN